MIDEQAAPPSPPAGIPTNEERTMAMLAHLLALAGYLIPFGHIIGPLIIWLIKKDTSQFVNDQGKESLNFQITITILLIICVMLMFVIIGFFLLPLVALYSLVFVIVGGVKANGGERFRYPFAFRFIK